jgi:BirA family biotin operon repressor/biotin-[acetyl-CoA-carboxylase] ligase
MLNWRLHHREVTASTNLDAMAGVHGDVFTADFQTAGRGRLDHKWVSESGENLMMSAVLSVEGMSAEEISTFPLVVGLAVSRALAEWEVDSRIKWPNDIWVGGKKLAGVLCQLNGDNVIAGIGVNVNQTVFPPDVSGRAASLAHSPRYRKEFSQRRRQAVEAARDGILSELSELHCRWKKEGFAALHPLVAALDVLKGASVAVRQTDDDASVIAGICGGIAPDGSLAVGSARVYAGEAHVEGIS